MKRTSQKSNAPQPKRPRIFYEIKPTVSQFGSGLDDYVQKFDSYVREIPKFSALSCKSKFMIKDLPPDPEKLLNDIFESAIEDAMKESRKHDIEPTHLGCVITSEQLDPDICIPIRPVTSNTFDSILNRFLQIGQSKKQDDTSLFGAPFSIEITTLDRNGLQREKIVGTGRKHAAFHHNVDEHNIIKIKNGQDNFCLFYALQATLVYHIGGMDKKQFYEYLRRSQRFPRKVSELMYAVKAPKNLKEYDAEIYGKAVIDYWNQQFVGQHVFKLFVFGAFGTFKPLYKYGPEKYTVPIALYYEDRHFDGVRKVSELFGQNYCLACEQVYDKAENHSYNCKQRCIKCSRIGPAFPCKPEGNFLVTCGGCNKYFENESCYDHHKSSGFCNKSKKCTDCGKIWTVKDSNKTGRHGHVCGETFCNVCHINHDPKRHCFIEPLHPKQEKPYRLIAFDVETKQHLVVDAAKNKREHQVNFIAASVTCAKCIGSGAWRRSLKDGNGCSICGKYRTVAFAECDFNDTDVDKKVVTEDPVKSFIKWLLYELPLEHENIIYSHYGGRFDMVLLFRKLFEEKLIPEMIRKGNKLYQLKVKKRDCFSCALTFRDSFNLLPMPLSALVPSFDLDTEEKAWFPHLANHERNYGKDYFPTPAEYLADGMQLAKRQKFMEWYEQHKNEAFRLEEALASYCLSDVQILMSALIKFQAEFFEVSKRYEPYGTANDRKPHSGIDVLRESMTIAGACMKHFRTNHLNGSRLGLVPHKGYDKANNQSRKAFKFFKYYAEKEGVKIRTAYSAGGEKKIGRHYVDGWIEEKQLAIEFNGCAFHGCERCYPDPNTILPGKRTAGFLRERDQKRLAEIRKEGVQVHVFWECQVDEWQSKDREMQKSFNDYADEGPIDLSKCFYGGRTGPHNLYYKPGPDEQISYFDVTSLYPFINFTTPYLLGHPDVHVLNEAVHWKRPEDNPFPLGILKIKVIPPINNKPSVLPFKLDNDERLLFGNCAACARKYKEGKVLDGYTCKHSDEERSFICTCTGVELNLALENGWKVSRIYRALEYTNTDNDLFKGYIREFMRMKIHASGFDQNIKGNMEAEKKFIEESKERFGIDIDRSQMIQNKGKRSLAKLMLNNLWGRFGLRNFGLSKSTVMEDPAELCKLLDDKSIDITGVDYLNKDVVMVTSITKEDFVEEHESSNVLLSLYTTSCARIHLYSLMKCVVETPGCKILYTDTDSIIYVHPKGMNPLRTGLHLGDLTDEYPDHDIVEWVCAGSKQYGLKLSRKADGKIEHTIKMRGITLNYDVMVTQNLHYETFKDKIFQFVRNDTFSPMIVRYPNIIRPSIRDGSVYSQPFSKIVRPVISKGIVDPISFDVRHFGFVEE